MRPIALQYIVEWHLWWSHCQPMRLSCINLPKVPKKSTPTAAFPSLNGSLTVVWASPLLSRLRSFIVHGGLLQDNERKCKKVKCEKSGPFGACSSREVLIYRVACKTRGRASWGCETASSPCFLLLRTLFLTIYPLLMAKMFYLFLSVPIMLLMAVLIHICSHR